MKRTIKKQFWFSRDEAQDLRKKAKKTCLSEAALVRLLLRGYEPKEMLPRLTPKQRQRANALIKRLCANYDNGNCLALDDGEPCACVQSISYSLLCKYFRKAVLPAKPLLEADILGTRFEKCVSCGTPIIKKGNRKKYCEKCAQRAYKAQQAEYARRKRAESKNRR